MRRNFSESSEIPTFFLPKTRWSPKKKKVFTEIETDFSAKIGNSNVFSARKQVVSKKKKKVFTEIQTLFHSESRHLLHNFGTQLPLKGGCFQFFTKNRPQKYHKRAILHTSQANGGSSSPPRPPPWLRYCIQNKAICKILNLFFTKIASKKRIELFNFSIGFVIVKNLVLKLL